MKGGEQEEEGNNCHSPALSFPCLIPVGLSVGTSGILRGCEGLQMEIITCFSPYLLRRPQGGIVPPSVCSPCSTSLTTAIPAENSAVAQDKAQSLPHGFPHLPSSGPPLSPDSLLSNGGDFMCWSCCLEHSPPYTFLTTQLLLRF